MVYYTTVTPWYPLEFSSEPRHGYLKSWMLGMLKIGERPWVCEKGEKKEICLMSPYPFNRNPSIHDSSG